MFFPVFIEFALLAEEAAGPNGKGDGQPPGGLSQLILMFAVIFFIFWLIIWRPESRKRKARELKIRSLKKGDQVVTTGGVFGKVVQVGESDVTVQIDKNKDVRVRFAKSAVFDVIVPGGEEKSGEAKQD